MENTNKQALPLRYQAVFLLEAETPLAVGSGDKHVLLDSPILRDAFGLPYIPGTGITGALRAALTGSNFDASCLGDKGCGSRLIVSSAHLFDGKQVLDGLQAAQAGADWLIYLRRDHVRINHRGVADKSGYGKFDSELLARGTRFVFELELHGSKTDQASWESILQALAQPLFRLGGGTRKGFGKMRIVECYSRTFDLTNQGDLKDYLQKSSRLQMPPQGFAPYAIATPKTKQAKHYRLQLQARDFFLFDGQFEEDANLSEIDKDTRFADMTPKVEKCLKWVNGQPQASEYQWVVPASSVKGALAHRVAYHYNLLCGQYALPDAERLQKIQALLEQQPPQEEQALLRYRADVEKMLEYLNAAQPEESVGENNRAVQALFGCMSNDQQNQGQRGRVLLSDAYISKQDHQEKVLNHVSIDRFTGGALDTALFAEKVVGSKETIVLDIWVENAVLDQDPNIKKAWEATLDDLVQSRLPLGGGVMRGHGMMQGSIESI